MAIYSEHYMKSRDMQNYWRYEKLLLGSKGFMAFFVLFRDIHIKFVS